MDFSIILPAYNEGANLPSLLPDIKTNLNRLGINYEIVLVDNGSTDNTRSLLEVLKLEIPQLKTIRIEQNIGFGNGILQGLAVSAGEILGFMDADGQIAARYLVEAYQQLKKENLDLCKGKRISRNDGYLRRLASKIYNRFFKIMFGGNFRDIGAKPKVFTRQLYEDIEPISKDWFLDTEIMLKIIKKKYKVGEFPITFPARLKGKSKVRLSTLIEFLKNMFYWRFFAKY